jgi:hypothetical protein
MCDMATIPAHVEVGQRYEGWGKTWEVTRIWPTGVAEAVNVSDRSNTIRWPLVQFRNLKRSL